MNRTQACPVRVMIVLQLKSSASLTGNEAERAEERPPGHAGVRRCHHSGRECCFVGAVHFDVWNMSFDLHSVACTLKCRVITQVKFEAF